MGTPIRIGLLVTWNVNDVRYEGVIRRIEAGAGYSDGIERVLIEPTSIGGKKPPNDVLWPLLKQTELRVPLHDGVFASDESVDNWTVSYRAAQAKMAQALANGALDRFDADAVNIPDEILTTIKQVIAVLGTEEAIRLISSLFKR